MQVLVVRKNGLRLRAEKVVIPNAEQAEDDWQIFLQRGCAKMLVHRVRAFEQLLEILGADGKHDRQADRRPERVPPAHPVPELKHIRRINAEFCHFIRVGGHGDKMLRHGRLLFRRVEKPPSRRVGVGQRLLGRERLRGNDEQRGFRVQRAQCFGNVCAVHVRHKMQMKAPLAERFQCLGDHDRAEVRAANADVGNVGDGLAGVALPRAAADFVTKHRHLLQHAIDLGHHVFTVHKNRAIGSIAQRDVQHGAVLGEVDLLPREHLLRPPRHVRLQRQVEEEPHGFVGHAVFRVIEEDVTSLGGELFKAPRVGCEQLPQVQWRDRLAVFLQRLPGGRFGQC